MLFTTNQGIEIAPLLLLANPWTSRDSWMFTSHPHQKKHKTMVIQVVSCMWPSRFSMVFIIPQNIQVDTRHRSKKKPLRVHQEGGWTTSGSTLENLKPRSWGFYPRTQPGANYSGNSITYSKLIAIHIPQIWVVTSCDFPPLGHPKRYSWILRVWSRNQRPAAWPCGNCQHLRPWELHQLHHFGDFYNFLPGWWF